jgi:hypothetical protein
MNDVKRGPALGENARRLLVAPLGEDPRPAMMTRDAEVVDQVAKYVPGTTDTTPRCCGQGTGC